MGNHDAGKAMGVAARSWWAGWNTAAAFTGTDRQPTKEEALKALDDICRPWEHCDAEWEAEDPDHPGQIDPVHEHYDEPEGVIGRLIVIAFDVPSEVAAGYYKDDDPVTDEWPGDAWYDGPRAEFKKRYDFY